MKMMVLNAYENDGGSKRLTMNENEGFECYNCEEMVRVKMPQYGVLL